MRTYPVSHDSHGNRIVVLCARFNEEITRRLLDGALLELKKYQPDENRIEVAWVPGSFELPAAAKAAALRTDVAAVVCLGAVIRGETPHFDFVSQAAAMGILHAGLETGKPITFGVLTTDSVEQAFDRAGGKVGNKGADAALAALEMLNLLPAIGGRESSL